jgi:hypothetical protein
MAKPIKPTPVLRGKAAESFYRKLEAEKNVPVYISSHMVDENKVLGIIASLGNKPKLT